MLTSQAATEASEAQRHGSLLKLQTLEACLHSTAEDVALLRQKQAGIAQRSHTAAIAKDAKVAALEHSNQQYKDSLAKALANLESTTASLSSSHASDIDVVRGELRATAGELYGNFPPR